MKLSDNLKNIRKENNLSQEQLAEKLGVSRQAVSKWESDQSYPEMDKVLLICKIFNYNIDELINGNVKEVSETRQYKINISKYIDDFFAFITKTVDMFSSMKFKQKLKCFIEQVIVTCILFSIFAIIGEIGSNIFYRLTNGIHSNIIYSIRNILDAIYLTLAISLGIIVWLHIFKIRYLDYFEIVKEKNVNENNNIVQDNIKTDEKNKIVLEKRKENIIIRDPEHSKSKFLTGIFKIIIWFVKIICTCIAVGFAFPFVSLVVLLILSFLFIKTGLLFIGTFLGIVSALIINFIILELLFNFVIGKTNKKNRLAILLITSLVLAGISIGLVIIGITNFNYIENSDINNEVENIYEVQMEDNLFISSYYNNIEYIETDSETVKIIVKHSKYYDVDILRRNNNGIYINSFLNQTKIMEMIRSQINDINNKEIKNYETYNISIYTSKENIEKIRKDDVKLFVELK